MITTISLLPTLQQGAFMFLKGVISFMIMAGIVSLQAQQTPPPPPTSHPHKIIKPAAVPPAPRADAPVNSDAATQSGDMFVSRAAIALDIEEHEPKDTGSVFPPEVKRLYCFSEIKNGQGSQIEHRWYWKDQLTTTMTLQVITNRFRTQSAKTIVPTMTGDWRVAIVNSKDESVLKMLSFTIK
jgi:hypothetical protein